MGFSRWSGLEVRPKETGSDERRGNVSDSL